MDRKKSYLLSFSLSLVYLIKAYKRYCSCDYITVIEMRVKLQFEEICVIYVTLHTY